MKSALQIIAACQSVIARFLPPDGIREDFALQKLIEILDSPEANALTMPQPGLESALSEDQLLKVSGPVTALQEAQAAMAARRGVVRSFTSDAIAQHPIEPAEVTIARLREAVQHLTEERDEERRRRASLSESADNRIEEQSAKIAELQRRLHRAEEKIKGVAFALAEV